MEKFTCYLKSVKLFKNCLASGKKQIHISLGNESCDLDSMVSSLIWGYFVSVSKPEYLVLPVLNVTRENFLLRTENCFVLEQAGIEIDNLIFRDQIDFTELSKNYTSCLSATLVDHHVLNKNDEILYKHVTQIFDHRPLDSSVSWDVGKVIKRIEQVGSCCTLISDEILRKSPHILTLPLSYLLYQTIIYDTIALVPENGKAKPLDIDIGLELEKTYNFSAEKRQEVFDKLWAAHNDISNLTPKQLLYKDLKLIDGIYIPGLPTLVEDYLKLDGSLQAIRDFADNHNVTCLILIGLDASITVKRDLAIYSKNSDDKLKKILLGTLQNNWEEFKFEKRPSDDEIYLLHVHNIKLSRKQLVPLVKDAWLKFTA
ncbi:exopolyphosphatase prune [Rhynchophorus ferrugineus]|uniref:DHHA2 domain-containing protein n=1 Tax=Rhynchophorus ferrugineus TaxID=354439 RepID=A0A834ME43_RHYFE|nr:hypothetical protein GWI33_005058 [Rhynchophorus ferrugineus]